MKKDIYIVKNSINEKVYIGQAKNVHNRWLHHLYDARYENKKDVHISLLHDDMSKLGEENFYYEILESQVENYDEREVYWIDKYNSRTPNGYNIAIGGQGSGPGIYGPRATFRTEEELKKCIEEISSSKKSFENIAKKYGCALDVICAINQGYRYKDNNLEYPLRQKIYSDALIKQLRYSIKYEEDLSLKDIAKKYNVDLSQLSLINQGKIYYVSSEDYPLRKKRKRDLDQSLVDDVINDILNSEMSMSEIAAKHNISRNAVTGINYGRNYKRPDIDYPLRLQNDPRNKDNKKFFEREDILNIHKLLKNGVSSKIIAEQYGVTSSTINNINAGRTIKYRIEGVKYPIRDFK